MMECECFLITKTERDYMFEIFKSHYLHTIIISPDEDGEPGFQCVDCKKFILVFES